MRVDRTALALGALALLLYLPGFWWGAPDFHGPDRAHSWGVDAHMPLGPLSELYNIFRPQPDRNLGYPLMHSFLVAAAYAPYFAWLWISGGIAQPSGVYPFGLADPPGSLHTMLLIAHLVSVLMGAGTAVAAYDAARSLWGRRAGILAALFAMTMFPLFYYARVGNVDAPMLFFIACAMAAFARILAGGMTVRRATWLGAFIGLAMATKEQAFACFLGLPLVLPRRPLRAWVAAACAAAVWFGAGSGLFVDPDRFFAHLEFVAARTRELTSGALIHLRPYPRDLEGTLALAALIAGHLRDSLTLPGLLLGLGGVVWTAVADRRRLAFALPLATYLAVLFFVARNSQLRFVLPAAFVLALFSGRFVAAMLESRHVAVPGLAVVCAGGALVLALARGADLTHAMIGDSRYEASRWLAGRARAGDRVETFMPIPALPPLPRGVEAGQAIRFGGLTGRPLPDDEAAAIVADGWRERRPRFVVVMPDYTSKPGRPHGVYCPEPIYRGLRDGSLGYSPRARFHTQPLAHWIARPALDYPSVNPPIEIFERRESP
jgi:hypothetical protein